MGTPHRYWFKFYVNVLDLGIDASTKDHTLTVWFFVCKIRLSTPSYSIPTV